MGYQTHVGFQTWDDGVPDRWWGTRQGWVKKGNLSFSELSNVHFNLRSRGFNITSRKIISFTSRGNLNESPKWNSSLLDFQLLFKPIHHHLCILVDIGPNQQKASLLFHILVEVIIVKVNKTSLSLALDMNNF